MINFLKNFFDRYFYDDEQYAALFILSIGIIILYFLGGIIAPVLVSILIAIEIIKELPITLILRPFNFETFATTAYIYASQDLLEAAAAPSLFLILIASVFILFVSKYILSDN